MNPVQTEAEAYKFCPRCGAPAPIEREALRCAACNLDMYLSTKTGACVTLTDREGRICVTRRARDPYKGMLDNIGGFIIAGEDLETCALRELKEEAGLELTADRLHYMGSEAHPYVRKGIMLHVVAPYFRVFITDTEKETMIPKDDVASFIWYLPEELPEAEFYDPSVYRILARPSQQS